MVTDISRFVIRSLWIFETFPTDSKSSLFVCMCVCMDVWLGVKHPQTHIIRFPTHTIRLVKTCDCTWENCSFCGIIRRNPFIFVTVSQKKQNKLLHCFVSDPKKAVGIFKKDTGQKLSLKGFEKQNGSVRLWLIKKSQCPRIFLLEKIWKCDRHSEIWFFFFF